MASSIGIVGCGWLGLPLGISLVAQDHEVHGSTTRQEKLALIESHGIIAHQLNLDHHITINPNPNGGLYKCDTYIINIPPGRNDPNIERSYPQKIQDFLNLIWTKSPKIIFISTTGVYHNSGEMVDESIVPNPRKPSGKAVLAAENIVRRIADKWIILRLAGLVGGSRQPANWFSGKTDVPGGDTPVNMIHLDDCIAIISQLISADTDNEIYNACADFHPVKRDFYAAQSLKVGVPMPTWQAGILPHKIVNNAKLKLAMDYAFIRPNPMYF